MNSYFLTIILFALGDSHRLYNDNAQDGLTEFEALVRTNINEARCKLTCISLNEEMTEYDRCFRVCLTGDFSVCEYDWLCTGPGCKQACQPSLHHKFISTDISVEGCGLTIPQTGDNADVVYIIGAKDRNSMWRLLQADLIPGGQLNLEQDDLYKYLSLGMIGVSKAGVVEHHNIPIQVFNCDSTMTSKPARAQPLHQENPSNNFAPKTNLAPKADDHAIEDNHIFQHKLNNDDINRGIMLLLTSLVFVCACVLLVLFSMYLCYKRTGNKLDKSTNEDSESVHFDEIGSSEEKEEREKIIIYEEIVKA